MPIFTRQGIEFHYVDSGPDGNIRSYSSMAWAGIAANPSACSHRPRGSGCSASTAAGMATPSPWVPVASLGFDTYADDVMALVGQPRRSRAPLWGVSRWAPALRSISHCATRPACWVSS